jgi:hypothetical protein
MQTLLSSPLTLSELSALPEDRLRALDALRVALAMTPHQDLDVRALIVDAADALLTRMGDELMGEA